MTSVETSPAAKRVKLGPLAIGTHSGHFHADEALAVYMLRQLPQYKDATLTRSRNPEALEKCDIIVDVGGKYDGVKYFDHHQRGFEEVFSESFKTKLSSAGLVYKHFGKALLAHKLGNPEDSDETTLLYNKIYKDFIEALDANDNGIALYDTDQKPKFNASGITLPSIVGGFNPEWNNPVDQAKEDELFLQASDYIGNVLTQKINYYGKSWLPARSLVVDAFKARMDVHPSGKILKLSTPMPWKDHLFTIEEEMGLKEEEKPFYVLYPDGPGKPGWRIQCIPTEVSSFTNRKGLPEVWRGLRDEELSKTSGIDGGVFVHASGFIGGNASYDGAFEMAKQSVEKF